MAAPSNVAELLLPAIRWDAERGYEPARDAIAHALEIGVGGFILFGGEEEAVRALTKELRSKSRIPLLIGSDLERGAGQQISGATGLPPLAALASLKDIEVIYKAARLSAREARTLGITWNYSPVCDLDVVPENPIIGTRALGGDPAFVSKFAAAWIEACQREGVLACAKHFPGHGRTTGDSHMTMPVVDAPRTVLLETDIMPFRAAIAAGVASIMTAHVAYPALDASRAPATLSTKILHFLLREKLRFDGLIVTDALIMEGVLGPEGESGAAVRAIDAGCDLLLYPQDIDAVIKALEIAVRDGPLDEDRILQSRRRRLKWAQWAAPPTDYRRPSGADLMWGAQIAERVIHVVRGKVPPVSGAVDVVVVDDDLGGPYPAPSREPFFASLKGAGLAPRRVESIAGAGGPAIIALFGDIRSWKGRPGYSEAARQAVAAAAAQANSLGREALVVQFSHPRLAVEIPEATNVVSAWGGDRCMQEAAGRWLARAR